MRSIAWLILLLAITSQTLAQQHIQQQIKNLDKDFRSFQYHKVIEKGKFLLSDPYVTKDDSLTIYKYMLNAAYALADTAEAKSIIKQIIKCDPEFALNPQDTSPKIIEFFNHVKNQIKQHRPVVPAGPGQPEHTTPSRIVYKPLPFSSALYSILLPGSGHLHQKIKGKGMRYTAVSLGLIGGMAYAIVQTVKKRDDYMHAERGADFERLYNDYNKMYKIRNILIGAFVVWDLYAFFDLQKQWQVSLQAEPVSGTMTVGISTRW